MIKIDDNTIFVGQIKQLLKEFNLPIVKIYNDSTILSENQIYLKDEYLIKCEKIFNNLIKGYYYKNIFYLDSQYINIIKGDTTKIYYDIIAGKFYKYKNDEEIYIPIIYKNTAEGTLYLDEINKELYIYNKSYLNITKNLQIENLLYDKYTHNYLGEYLRFLRDYKKIDLMSMYNCFDGTSINNFHISKEFINQTDEPEENKFNKKFNRLFTIDNNYIIYAVPVKFNQIYSIGLNCSAGCELFLGIYNEELIHSNNNMIKLCNSSYKQFNYCSLNKVQLYNTTINNELNSLLNYEKDLKLFIRIPFNNKSSLVVLEGDYRKYSQKVFETNHLANITVPTTLDDGSINIDTYISDLELLSSNNSIGQYVLATRLVEYLTDNVITLLSKTYDIKKLQKVLIKRGAVKSDYLGIWSDNDKKGLYGTLLNEFESTVIPYDSIGYLDKDIEQKLIAHFNRIEDLGE